MKKENKFFRFAILCSGIVALFAFVSLGTIGYGAGSNAAISVVGDGIPGKAMKINGTGFLPDEVIELVLEMEDVPIIVGKKGETIKAKEDGTFTATTNYPHKFVAIPGFWDLTANGSKGTNARCKVEIKKP